MNEKNPLINLNSSLEECNAKTCWFENLCSFLFTLNVQLRKAYIFPYIDLIPDIIFLLIKNQKGYKNMEASQAVSGKHLFHFCFP